MNKVKQYMEGYDAYQCNKNCTEHFDDSHGLKASLKPLRRPFD